MRTRLIAFIVVSAAILTFYGLVLAQVWTQQSTAISSATVPVNVMTAAARKAFCITTRSSPVLCFAYNGAIPTGVPAAMYQISTPIPFCNGLTGIGQDTAINEAWACVPAAAGTVTVDSVWR